jgi:hypothetical protein
MLNRGNHMNKNLDLLLEDFELFCTNNIISGKSRSYKLAIKYLCDFLDIKILDEKALDKMTNTKNELNNANSLIYKECLKYLRAKGRSSYLLKGFISASFTYFIAFLDTYN